MNHFSSFEDSSLVILSESEKDHLLRAIESGMHVNKRHQFFLWSQGQLRGILPHEILVGIRLDENNQAQQVECFHSRLLGADYCDGLCNPHAGLAVELARLCAEGHRLAIHVDDDATLRRHHPEWIPRLREMGLKNVLACGTERILGNVFVYVLFDMENTPTHRHIYFLELMLPHLQMAMMRLAESIAVGNDPPPPVPARVKLITDREVQILGLVQQGKSNQEIAETLGISPLTVKNHVQKVYRKLKVQNRAHAVSRGISLRLLDSANP